MVDILPYLYYTTRGIEAWLSLVERCVRDAEAVGSNPTSPTKPPRGRALAAAHSAPASVNKHSPMFYVYVLRSEKTGRRYVGSTQDVQARLQQHNSGQSLATKHGVPWRLTHQEEFVTRAKAVRRERFYKTGRGRKILDQLAG